MELSELIEKLTSAPAAANGAAELASKLMQSTGQGAPPQAENAPAQTPAPTQNGDMLSSVLSDPAFLAKMPQMLSAIAPMLQNSSSQPTAAVPAALPAAVNTSEQAKRNALLLALKPYLSHERAEAVDHIIRLTGLIELFSMLR